MIVALCFDSPNSLVWSIVSDGMEFNLFSNECVVFVLLVVILWRQDRKNAKQNQTPTYELVNQESVSVKFNLFSDLHVWFLFYWSLSYGESMQNRTMTSFFLNAILIQFYNWGTRLIPQIIHLNKPFDTWITRKCLKMNKA